MTTPISTPNSSYYDPSAQFTPADGSTASGSTDISAGAPLPPEVTIAPIEVIGEAGAQELLKRYDATAQSPDCSLEGKSAALSCAKAGLTAAGGVLISSTGVGAAIGVAATLVESISCGKDLRAYYDCKTQ